MRAILVCLFLSLLAACAAKQKAVSPVYPGSNLLAELRQGGHVLYLRHAETETAQESVVRDMADCTWQRNLNHHGRDQATKIGAHLREAGISFTGVEASPFCRTRETAMLVFGRTPVLNRDLYYHASQTLPEIDTANSKLKARLSQRPAGGNLALVGHAPTMREAAKIELPEGQGALVKPTGNGTFRVVARVSTWGISPERYQAN
jgi:phosphohistidine phosphatase SixA